MLVYCAIHAAWVWPPLRFAVPVIPLLLWLAFIGAAKQRVLGCVVARMLFAAGGFQLWMTVVQAREKGMVSPLAGTENWNDTARLLNWISLETPQDATLTGNLDPMYYLFTGRKAVRAFTANPFLLYYNPGNKSDNPLGTIDDLRKRLIATKADYLIMTPSGGFGEIPYLDRLVSDLSSVCQGSLAQVTTGRDPRYVIYKIDRTRLESQDTCGPRT
mgnify:CR=1 FL=1